MIGCRASQAMWSARLKRLFLRSTPLIPKSGDIGNIFELDGNFFSACSWHILRIQFLLHLTKHHHFGITWPRIFELFWAKHTTLVSTRRNLTQLENRSGSSLASFHFIWFQDISFLVAVRSVTLYFPFLSASSELDASRGITSHISSSPVRWSGPFHHVWSLASEFAVIPSLNLPGGLAIVGV